MARIDNPAGMRLDKLLKHTHTPDHVSTATHHIPLLKDFSHKEINNSVFCTGVIWTSRGTGLYLPWTIWKSPGQGWISHRRRVLQWVVIADKSRISSLLKKLLLIIYSPPCHPRCPCLSFFSRKEIKVFDENIPGFFSI